MPSDDTRSTGIGRDRSFEWFAVGLMVIAAFFGSYAFALDVKTRPEGGGSAEGAVAEVPEDLDPRARMEGEVQTLYIDSSAGFNPNTVYAKAGVPLEVTFGQGSGCYYGVKFPDFGVEKDLTQGPVTIELPAMEPGQYQFACSMDMVFGLLIVEA